MGNAKCRIHLAWVTLGTQQKQCSFYELQFSVKNAIMLENCLSNCITKWFVLN